MRRDDAGLTLDLPRHGESKMPAKGLLLRSLVKLLEMVLPKQPTPPSPNEIPLDPPMDLAVRVVETWARVNQVPIPRLWIVYSADRCSGSGRVRSEIHWAIKTLFTHVRDDHARLLDEQYRFKLELAVATASRAWRLIEERDDDEEFDGAGVIDAYAGMFDPTLAQSV
jgi:hypothetical protein